MILALNLKPSTLNHYCGSRFTAHDLKSCVVSSLISITKE